MGSGREAPTFLSTCRFTDPARFSFAHGGKDGHPFPVPLRVYDETLRVMRDAVERAKLGIDDRLAALHKLAEEARRLESAWRGPPFERIVAKERASSFAYGGMTVSGPARKPPHARSDQLELP